MEQIRSAGAEKKNNEISSKIQIWGGISKLGKTSLVLWKTRGKSEDYQNMIEEPLKEFQKRIGKKRFRSCKTKIQPILRRAQGVGWTKMCVAGF